MNINDLNQLTNELLTAYLDRSPVPTLEDICKRFNIEFGGTIFFKAVNRGMEWLNTGEYDLLSESNRDKLIHQSLLDMEEEFGATLGVDYSKTTDGYILSSELSEKIQANRPDVWRKLEADENIKIISQDPYQLLEQHLGVPFFESLLSIAKQRILTLNDNDAAYYIYVLLDGMILANPWLKNDSFITQLLKLSGIQLGFIAEYSESSTEIMRANTITVLDDLLTALGRTERTYYQGEIVLSEDDLRAIDKVWHGNICRPVELAEKLRKLR
jgi:hypothetical protein